MRDLAQRAMDTAHSRRAEYADCRVVVRRSQTLAVKNGEIVGIDIAQDEGCGIRAVADGAWGFASTDRLDSQAVDAAVEMALRVARASSRQRRFPVRLAQLEAVAGEYQTPLEIDPFTVSLEDKVGILLAADAAMARVPEVTVRRGALEAIEERRVFASSEGSLIEQRIVESGGGLDALATSSDEVQTRSYPNSFGRHQLCAGWEAITAMDLPGNAERIASEAAALLSAERCPEGVMTLILDGTQAAMQVHESCGHATELDRVLGWEAAYAGTSFLTTDLLGHFRYGSDQVTITADATRKGGLGTFGWDDEGVPAQRTVLVDRGLFSAYMSSRETAVATKGDGTSSGTMRAEGWNRIPLIRMTNVNLEPGTSSLEEMISTTRHGVYLETNRSWSIDDRRLNFQFGCQNGWEIRDGRRVRLVRNSLYQGITPDFWRSCDAVAGPDEWQMWGVVNCGKGQPPQAMHVGHGAAPCRFQNVKVRAAG